MTFKSVSASELHELLSGDEELAFLDVREHGVHSQGHPFWSVPAALSHLELNIERLVPRKDTSLYLLDQGDGEALAERAANILGSLGYSEIFLVEKGILGWQEAGLEIFSGVNVPSKAFGEFVEHEYDTPYLTADTLKSRIDQGEKITILDSRPFEEFQRMSIPGGVDMPGAELVHRVFEHVQDDQQTIVVNCAGRTRSIIGAQSLINAGVKNPVYALKDGTMGWYLAGHELARGEEAVAPASSGDAFNMSLNAARRVGKIAGIELLSAREVLEFTEAAVEKSVYLLDVRTREEFLQEHVAGAQHAPGGQLVQATDEYVATRNGTLILLDDREVRAWMSASWLRQLGWEHVYICSDFESLPREKGLRKSEVRKSVSEVTAFELDAVIASNEPVAVIDFSNSLAFRKEHIPGAFWAIRSRIQHDLKFLPPVGYIIVTADDPALAHLVAPEVARMCPNAIVNVLRDGNESWRQAGFDFEAGDTHHLSKPDDIWYKPYDNREKIRERMQEYLDWEVALVPQVKRDGTAKFKKLSFP
ncbi:MAG: hypothetical protein MI743_12850 [Sneathiellales bacterium]|nr:hypothetical protein [Sneathiellales bacterium]